MWRGTTFLGMDVHKSTINIAVLEEGKPAPIEWVLENRTTFAETAAQATFDHSVRTLEAAQERQKTLDEKVEEIARRADYESALGVLRCTVTTRASAKRFKHDDIISQDGRSTSLRSARCACVGVIDGSSSAARP